MIDGHIHIERGPYTLEWIQKFVDKAVEEGLDEIRLLEHNFRFEEFVPMYDSVRAYSDFVDAWFRRVGGVRKLEEYLTLIELVRRQKYPVEIKFGMEVCYFPKYEEMTRELTQGKGFDFLLGSVHFAGISRLITLRSCGKGRTLTRSSGTIMRMRSGLRSPGCSTGSGIRTRSNCSGTGRRFL